jgi:hypothetical protein
MNNASYEKPVPQVALEVMMKRNKEQAEKLLNDARKLLQENRVIEVEMSKVLASAPPPSQVTPQAAPPSVAPSTDRMVPSMRPDPAGGLFHAADALVRSWKRRGKKNFKQLERDLMMALERMNG